MDADGLDSPANAPSSSASASDTQLALRPRRRPIPRKGHTKSRRGCFNCKRRKVKCPETLPECANCVRFGLPCEYPDARPRALQLAPSSSPPGSWLSSVPPPSAPLRSSPTLFTPDDMRFFHHFLVTAYPPLPILDDGVWRNVAVLSHSVRLALSPTAHLSLDMDAG